MKTVTITCKVPVRLGSELESVAHDEGISKSQFMRSALEDRIRQKRKKKVSSAYDLAKHVCGKVKLPADILTNPKYMDGFGG